MISCKNNPKKRKKKTHGQLSKSKLKEHFQSQPFVTISPCITFFCIFFQGIRTGAIPILQQTNRHRIWDMRQSHNKKNVLYRTFTYHEWCIYTPIVLAFSWTFRTATQKDINSHQPEIFHHETTREPWPSISRRSETRWLSTHSHLVTQ